MFLLMPCDAFTCAMLSTTTVCPMVWVRIPLDLGPNIDSGSSADSGSVQALQRLTTQQCFYLCHALFHHCGAGLCLFNIKRSPADMKALERLPTQQCFYLRFAFIHHCGAGRSLSKKRRSSADMKPSHPGHLRSPE